MDKPRAITVWTDESEIEVGGNSYCLIGQLITNSDTEEFRFLNSLKQARKEKNCWTSLHGSELQARDENQLALLKEWVDIFRRNKSVFFHLFLYKRDGSWSRRYPSPEHYFANQCYFGLGLKMRKDGDYLRTLFSQVGTVTAIFDRRRSHIAYIIPSSPGVGVIERLNDLESIFETKIKDRLCALSGKTKTGLTLRFSFAASKCFDALQLCDCLLYLARARILLEQKNESSLFSDMWNEKFIDEYHHRISDYSEDIHFNYFKSSFSRTA